MLKILADALLLATRIDVPREDHHSNRAADAEARRRREQMTITNLRF